MLILDRALVWAKGFGGWVRERSVGGHRYAYVNFIQSSLTGGQHKKLRGGECRVRARGYAYHPGV